MCRDYYINIKSTLLTSEEHTDENIVQKNKANEQCENDGEDKVENEPLAITEEALKAIKLLSRLVHSNIENDII